MCIFQDISCMFVRVLVYMHTQTYVLMYVDKARRDCAAELLYSVARTCGCNCNIDHLQHLRVGVAVV